MNSKIDVLFVGAGPASLAGAIRLKQLLNQSGRQESVVVIEKSAKLGQHNLSGAVFEPAVLDELLPEWKKDQSPFVTGMLASEVKADEIYFLTSQTGAMKMPEGIIPKAMHNMGNYAISIDGMVNWLAGIAQKLGVEVYNGFAAKELVIQNNKVTGVKLGEKGLDKEKKHLANYIAGDVLEAKITILGEGSAGQLGEALVKKFDLGKNCNPQIFSVGVKEILRMPEKNNFGPNHVVHCLGFPLPSSMFGGGSIYSMSPTQIAVSQIMGLDWKYCDLNPEQELQRLKSHKLIKHLIEGGDVVAYGAKTLPEGGYYSVPELAADGAMIIGDDAGLTNAQKLKGLHYAIKSGLTAAEAAFQALQKNDFSKQSLSQHRKLLENSFVMRELYEARNYRQVFLKGIYFGMPMMFFQKMMGKLATKPDYEHMKSAKLNHPAVGMDRLTGVSFSGTAHREDEPSHISFKDPAQCDKCAAKVGCHPCEYFCPAEVYVFEGEKLMLNPSNCVHCQTCRIKCPSQNINWEVPEGGDGPRYKLM
jgi:electron-transferring-flavoprotein dehydrogenase